MSESTLPPEQREFRCDHCNGKIRIPRSLPPTTAPCPHCSALITSPEVEEDRPAAQMPITPAPAPVPQAPAPPSAPEAPAAPASPPPPASPSPATAPAPVASSTRLPSSSRTTTSAASPRSFRVGLLVLLLLAILGASAIVYFVVEEMGKKSSTVSVVPGPLESTLQENQYLRIGWQKEGYDVLGRFLAGNNVAAKVPYILGGEQNRAKLDAFYGEGVIDDRDTPADAFTAYKLSDEDHQRGLFMMIYEQPPQFDMKEFFRPLAPLEVQYGIDEADLLLTTLASVENFAMEPVLAHAFFKRTPDGLKLDWDIFAQTKYRTFRNFIELPDPGNTKVFRVLIEETVSERGRSATGERTYRLVDPSAITAPLRHFTDVARVNVPVDSEVGRILSILNWRGTETGRPITRTATVELTWTDREPYEVRISRFVCWEFLGLGGEEVSDASR